MKKKTKKIILITLIVGALLATVLSAGYYYLVNQLKSTLTGCEPEREQFNETIDFEYIGGWIVINVKVAGNDMEYPFIFDTGSTTIVSDSLVKELKPGSYKTFFSGKDNDTTNAFNNQLLVLNKLSMGGISFRNIGSMVLENKNWDMLNCISAYGIIGCNIIKTGCFQIDYEKKTITITDNVDNLPEKNRISWLKYKTDGQETPVITAILDSLKIDLFFDTGSSSGITLYSPEIYRNVQENSLAEKAVFNMLPSLYIRGEKARPYKAVKYSPSQLEIFGTGLSKKTPVTVTDTPERKFTGTIGNRYLSDFIITLDYKNKRVGYTLNEIPEPEYKGSFGFGYFVHNNKVLINSVKDGSEIAEKGIQPGDEIISINGIEISKLPAEAFCRIFRNEFSFSGDTDSLMDIAVRQGDNVIDLSLHKFLLTY